MDRLDAKIENAQDKMIARIDRVVDKLTDIHLMLGRHDARLDTLEGKG